jgi:hypothetical protein
VFIESEMATVSQNGGEKKKKLKEYKQISYTLKSTECSGGFIIFKGEA